MSNTYTIYMHTSPSGKSYIGQTKNTKQRDAAHRIPSSRCTAFKNAIAKYGWENFSHTILADGLTLSEANALEEQLIARHNTLAPHGYNLRSGGENQLMSDDTKQKLSNMRRGKQRTPEHQAKLNEAARQRVRTPEHQAKLNEAARRARSDDTKQKISRALTGRAKTDEHKQKIKQTLSGREQTDDHKQHVQARKIGRRMYRNVLTGERKYFYPEDFTIIPLDTWIPVV